MSRDAAASPAPAAPSTTDAATATGAPARKAIDRSIVDGPLGPAVWRLAWPTILTNVVGGL